uniref:DUF1963 domain-containing protein n=1 Tax=Steinernema glaseri TaxID=37863 RepID=A0A1I7Y4I6_9BILA
MHEDGRYLKANVVPLAWKLWPEEEEDMKYLDFKPSWDSPKEKPTWFSFFFFDQTLGCLVYSISEATRRTLRKETSRPTGHRQIMALYMTKGRQEKSDVRQCNRDRNESPFKTAPGAKQLIRL